MPTYAACAVVLLVGNLSQYAHASPALGEAQPLAPLRNSQEASEVLKLLDLIYGGHSQHAFWKVTQYEKEAQEATKRSGQPSKSILYGEVQPDTLVQLLEHVGARPGQKYFDLGSGTGKTVIAAWLMGLDATGVELVGKRWNTACMSMLQAKRLGFKKRKDGPGLAFLHNSFSDVDLSDADIIFVNSKTFSPEMMAGLAEKSQHLRVGAKIISTSGFPGEGFRLEGKVIGPTSSDRGAVWTIQTVIASATNSVDANPARASASLIRREPAIPTPFKPAKKVIHMHKGPVLGSMQHGAEVIQAAGSKTCSLPEGDLEGFAARAATRSAKTSAIFQERR
jgi:hypothetical protein